MESGSSSRPARSPNRGPSGAMGRRCPHASTGRLVLLYARMGRIEDAKRHWRIFTETVRTPDSEIQPLFAEAREALASAEKLAGAVKH